MGDVGTWGMPALWDRRAQLLCRIPAPVWLPLPLGLHPRPQFSQGGLKAPPLLSAPLSAGSPPPFAGCRAGGAAFGQHGKAAPEQELLGKISLLRFYRVRAPCGVGGPSAPPRGVSSVEDPLLPAAAGADPEQGPPGKAHPARSLSVRCRQQPHDVRTRKRRELPPSSPPASSSSPRPGGRREDGKSPAPSPAGAPARKTERKLLYLSRRPAARQQGCCLGFLVCFSRCLSAPPRDVQPLGVPGSAPGGLRPLPAVQHRALRCPEGLLLLWGQAGPPGTGWERCR